MDTTTTTNSTITPYDKLNDLAAWLGTSVASAFFASLERCSCVNLNTADTDDEDEEEAKDRPLMLTNLNNCPSLSASTTNNNNPLDKLPV